MRLSALIAVFVLGGCATPQLAQLEMLAAGRRQGLLAYPLAPRLEAVLREVAAGHPVIVFQNLSLPIYPVWHYAVVIGFERERQTLLLHSGRTEFLEMSLATFERTWTRGQHWSMVLLLPSQLPVTAQPDTHATCGLAGPGQCGLCLGAVESSGTSLPPSHRSAARLRRCLE